MMRSLFQILVCSLKLNFVQLTSVGTQQIYIGTSVQYGKAALLFLDHVMPATVIIHLFFHLLNILSYD